MAKAKEIPYTQEQLRELLDYDPDTGVLRWRELYEGHGYNRLPLKAWRKQYAGKEAGSIITDTRKGRAYNYKGVFIGGSRYKAHRIIWIWMTGHAPPEHIDHINHDSTDNRWENLRDGSGIINRQNLALKANNKSGYTGAFKDKRTGRYFSQVGREYLGMYDTAEEAGEVARKRREELGYHENHGVEYSKNLLDKQPAKGLKTKTGIRHISLTSSAQSNYRVRFKIDGKEICTGNYVDLEDACLNMLEDKVDMGREFDDFQISSRHRELLGDDFLK